MVAYCKCEGSEEATFNLR